LLANDTTNNYPLSTIEFHQGQTGEKGLKMFESQESRVESRREALGARSEERGATVGRRDFTFLLPPSPFRLGISLTEVLIAMGIMTVGLLGVASVFPVGSWYARKADIADQGSAIAQSAMNDLVTRGLLNPDAWFAMTPPAGTPGATSPNFTFSSDGKYTPLGNKKPGTFTRPFAETLAEGLKLNPGNSAVLAKQFGHAYVIDPMFCAVAARNTNAANANSNLAAWAFPSAAYFANPQPAWMYYTNALWEPWRRSGNGKDQCWPIRRVTFQSSFAALGDPNPGGWPMDITSASSVCRANDDLTFDFPQRADRPSIQSWDTTSATSGALIPLSRKWTGDYSWIATVLATNDAARNGMAGNPEGFAYDVSVVVFYKRVLPPNLSTDPASAIAIDLTDVSSTERSVGATILSSGMNGGELLLSDMNDVKDANTPPQPLPAFDNLKVGNWIMLCGPHPNSTTEEPRFVLNWYQVLSVDGKGRRLNNQGTDNPPPASSEPERRVVTVRGPQWPWAAAATPYNRTASISNDLCVGIFRGAVAVHAKTVRLESSRGGAFGSGMSTIVQQGVAPGNTLH
jgi:hypothetical protein